MTSDATRLSIVVAEDDPDDRVLTCDAIRQSGIEAEVRFVTDGVNLIADLRAGTPVAGALRGALPDLIFVDLNMPRLKGVEAIRIIKADAGLRSIPVVVLTTSRREDDITDAYDSGASAYIVKPLTPEEFRTVVRDRSGPER